MTVRFVNKETGEIREQNVFMGDFPMMTDAGHVHHQRHRARHRHAARAVAGRLPDGAQGRDEAGLHREPDAEPAARGSSSRSTRRASSTPASTGSGSCRSRRCCARCRPQDPTTGFELDTTTNEAILEPLRQQPLHREDARQGPVDARGGGADRGLQEAAPGRAADGRQRPQPAQLAVLRPQALRPDEGRPLQAEPAPRRRRARGHARPHDAGHRRARPPARRAAEARSASPRTRRTTPPTRSACPATRSGPSSTSTSTSATGACARSAS